MSNEFDRLWIRSLSKEDLHSLIAQVKAGDHEAIPQAVKFVCAESFGIWHNRARAKLCRHFKTHPPSNEERRQLVEAVSARLIHGNFYEQFKDQLAMAVRFTPEKMREAALIARQSEKEYIQRYGRYVQDKIKFTVQNSE